MRKILTAVVVATLVTGGPSLAAASKKNVVGGVWERGTGKADKSTEVVYEITEPLAAPQKVCVYYENDSGESKGSIKKTTITLLRPDQTGDRCTIGNIAVTAGVALGCCHLPSGEDYPKGSMVQGQVRKKGLPKVGANNYSVTQIETIESGIPVPPGTMLPSCTCRALP